MPTVPITAPTAQPATPTQNYMPKVTAPSSALLPVPHNPLPGQAHPCLSCSLCSIAGYHSPALCRRDVCWQGEARDAGDAGSERGALPTRDSSEGGCRGCSTHRCLRESSSVQVICSPLQCSHLICPPPHQPAANQRIASKQQETLSLCSSRGEEGAAHPAHQQ